MAKQCELCDADKQYIWRIEDLEKKVGRLYTLLLTTALSSFGTLVGVITILLTK